MSRMQTVRTELKTDRLLLNPKFEGYKLSLDSFPMQSTKLSQSKQGSHLDVIPITLEPLTIIVSHRLLFCTLTHPVTGHLSLYTIF